MPTCGPWFKKPTHHTLRADCILVFECSRICALHLARGVSDNLVLCILVPLFSPKIDGYFQMQSSPTLLRPQNAESDRRPSKFSALVQILLPRSSSWFKIGMTFEHPKLIYASLSFYTCFLPHDLLPPPNLNATIEHNDYHFRHSMRPYWLESGSRPTLS